MPRYEIIRHTLVEPRTREEKAFLFITRVLLLIYLFISYSNDRSISSNFFPFTHSFSTEYESSSKKSSSAVFLHLLIRNLEIYKKKIISLGY